MTSAVCNDSPPILTDYHHEARAPADFFAERQQQRLGKALRCFANMAPERIS
jgi:hypothetical protein